MTRKRIIGIDLLRILSMYMIMTLHTMSNGGGLMYHQVNTWHTQTIIFLTFLNNIAVDLFALISGYVGLYSHHRTSRIVELWLQVVFYSWLILLIFFIWKPSYINHTQILGSMFPTVSMQYWYFNAYLVVFAFMPLLNSGIDRLSQKQFLRLCISLFVLTSILGLRIFPDKVFNLDWGFNGLWLIVMYIYGAYLKKYGHFLKSLSILWDFGIYFIISFVGVIVLNIMVIGRRGYADGTILYNDWFNWFGYNTPFAVLGSIFVFLAFLKVKITNIKWQKIIINLGSLSFGTYLLQTNYIVYAWFKNKYITYYDHNILIMVGLIFITALGWYLLGTLVDYFRKFIFDRLLLPLRVTSFLRFLFVRVVNVHKKKRLSGNK